MIEETKRKYYVNFKPGTEVPPSNRDRGPWTQGPLLRGAPLTPKTRYCKKLFQNSLNRTVNYQRP
jgi:hypothetical protein